MTEIGDDAAEKPLDPATERLRRKLVRLLALSVSTLFIGVMAVLGAIVYKLNRDAPPADPVAVERTVVLPSGSVLLDVTANSDTALLRLRSAEDGTQSLVRIDLATGIVLARYRLEGLAPLPAEPGLPAAASDGAPGPLLDLYRTR